ncbi:hypothetical protein CCAE64S_02343 [Castellaniella caeni]
MDASRGVKLISMIWHKGGCSLIFGLLVQGISLLALMESATTRSLI